jgi:hypothetical protein
MEEANRFFSNNSRLHYVKCTVISEDTLFITFSVTITRLLKPPGIAYTFPRQIDSRSAAGYALSIILLRETLPVGAYGLHNEIRYSLF